MKGQILSFVVTVMLIVAVVIFLVVAVIMSIFVKSSQAQRTADILTATEQPLSIVNGLLQTRMLDGRTLLAAGLHALGGARLALPPTASKALQSWEIANWRFSVTGQTEVQLGTIAFIECFSDFGMGRCVLGTCPAGSSTVPMPAGNTQCAAGHVCCAEAYNFTARNYTEMLRGALTCGPEGGYYGVCEFGGCSLERKDMGPSNCPDVPIGSHCCRPFTDSERAQLASLPLYRIFVPLLYPNMQGNLTIEVSPPQMVGLS